MKLRTLCMLLVLVLLAVFLVINWSALSQDMTVNLVYQEIQAPLGVIVAAAFGIDMIHLGVVVALAVTIGASTPPVGVCLFVLSTVTGEPLENVIAIKTVSMSLLEKSVKVLPGWRHSSRSSKKQRQS